MNKFKTALMSALFVMIIMIGSMKLARLMLASPVAVDMSDTEVAASLKLMAALAPIDAHVHVWQDSPAFYALLERVNMHVVNICVVDVHDDPIYQTLEPQIQLSMLIYHHSQGRAKVCTTFTPYDFAKPHFAQETIRQLDENFRDGAVAVKIYKNIGMELKWPSGKFLMPDDPVLEPIYQDIAAHNKSVIAHIAEPNSCWESYEEMGPNSPDAGYYRKYPFWYMYGKTGLPSKAEILAARDHMVEENPHLRVIGAHLGSLEWDVDEMAKRFDRYPNFAVDTAARVHYLMDEPREKVQAFMIKYQDRVLYGTDGDIHPDADAASRSKSLQDQFAADWKYFATDATFNYNGRNVQGLKLPPAVLRKLYHDNAVNWIPGILDPPVGGNH